MGQEIIVVDAFAEEPFTGNPAAVCVLPEAGGETWMQNVAREMHLSETAFLVAGDDGFDLRWFTPAAEVDLCGHATLASAHVLWETRRIAADQEARFHTRSGVLKGDPSPGGRDQAGGLATPFVGANAVLIEAGNMAGLGCGLPGAPHHLEQGCARSRLDAVLAARLLPGRRPPAGLVTGSRSAEG